MPDALDALTKSLLHAATKAGADAADDGWRSVLAAENAVAF